MYYWSGSEWLPIASGGGGDGSGTGPQGPPGADGISITVYGPTSVPPTNPRKGDQWLQEPAPFKTMAGESDVTLMAVASMTPEPLVVRMLPDPPKTVYVSYFQ
jgi:hypothetical protein